LGGERVKPAKDVKAGDELAVRIGDLEWVVHVLCASDRRGPAEEARRLYAETEESRSKRAQAIAVRKSGPQYEGRGRPTKRDRRLIHRFTREN
ncbi:MAG: RNA-binding S4 domain-containing protein, partial [Betaproteobacteria bacterium]|nr:RNA-binding S4 domain-containing protein [Betaproteobacteria bacterium]